MRRRALLALSPAALAVPMLPRATAGKEASVLLPASTGVDDTSVINAALAAGRLVTGLAGETYLISAPLVVGSGTTLDMTACTVTLLPGSNCHMVENVAVAGAGRDHDITIVGGTWVRGANAGVGNDRHSLFFRRADRLNVRDLRVTSTGGKYSVAAGDVTEVRVHDISLTTASDGVHITGPARAVDIRGISGTTGDDMVALTARDWAAYDDVHGDIDDVIIDGVYAAGSAAAVKIISGTDTAVSAVSVSHVYGTTTIRPIAIIDDTTGPTVADGIVISDLDVQCTNPTYSLIWLRGVASTDITIRDVRVRRPLVNAWTPMVLVDRTTNIGSLTIDGWLLSPDAVTTSPIVGVFGTAHVGVLRLSRVRTPAAMAWPGPPIKVGGSGTVTSSSAADVATY